MTKRVRRSDLCANFATDIEYYPYVIELFSRERGRFFFLRDFAPQLTRSGKNIAVSWSYLDGDDNERMVHFVDFSDFWSSFYVVMYEAYIETYSHLFAKSTIVN